MTRPQEDKDDLSARVARAALDGDLDHIRRLIAEGAQPQIDSNAAARILRSAENEAVPAAKMRKGLLETLVLHQQHGHINAAMYLAAYNGFDNIVDYFLQNDNADQLTLNVALFAAARAGLPALAEKLVKAGAEIDFKDGLPLRAAIDSGKDETVKFLLAQGAARVGGMVYAASRGNMSMTVMLINRDDDIRPALEKICQNLSPVHYSQPRVQDHLSVADMLLSLAEARGDDMASHLTWLTFAAAREKTTALVETIAQQPQFSALPAQCRRDLTDVLSPLLLATDEKSQEAAERGKNALLASGGAQGVLYAGIMRSDPAWVAEALVAGADPRREREKTLRLAGEKLVQVPQNQNGRVILNDVQQAVAAISDVAAQRTAQIFRADDMSVLLRQRDDQKGETGLMAAVDSGKFADVIKAVQKQNIVLMADDFTAVDPRGYNLIDRLEDHRQENLVFSPSLWRGRAAEFEKLWDAVPSHWHTEYADCRASLMATLDIDSDISHLKQAAGAYELRLLPRRKNNPPSHP